MQGERFERYMEHLAAGLGHAGPARRAEGLLHRSDAAAVAQERGADGRAGRSAARERSASVVASLRGQGRVVRRRRCCDGSASGWCRRWTCQPGAFWIIDDTGFPKKGKHSVGVARQYCGVLGKQDNCQVAVSISLANAQASLPVAYRLYLPKAVGRRSRSGASKAGVPPRCASPPRRRSRLAAVRSLAGRRGPEVIACWPTLPTESTRRFVSG